MREPAGMLRRHFSMSHAPEREFGIEIDPRCADADYVRGLAEAGMNRMSIGIQDFDPEGAGGGQPRAERGARGAKSCSRPRASTGFESISVDLIYGLPHQDAGQFRAHPGTGHRAGAGPHRRLQLCAPAAAVQGAAPALDAQALPDAATKLALFGRTLEMLTAAGYVYIGMDHFARRRRRAGAGPARRHPAAQFPGLFHARRLRHRRPGRERHQPHRRYLQPERARPAGLLRGAGCRPPAGGARAAAGRGRPASAAN